jgi:hypothetical protein
MERELILSVKSNMYDKKKVNLEIATIKKMLPYIESFESFAMHNEVFDLASHEFINKRMEVHHLFVKGLENNAYCIISKN